MSVTVFAASATDLAVDRIVIGHWTYNETTGGVFLPGTTTAAFTLNTEGRANVARNFNQIARGDHVVITNAPALNLACLLYTSPSPRD